MIDLENENGRCKHSKSEHHKNIIIVSKNQQIFNSNHSLNSKGKINETEYSVKNNLISMIQLFQRFTSLRVLL